MFRVGPLRDTSLSDRSNPVDDLTNYRLEDILEAFAENAGTGRFRCR